ncbi:MAG: nuclear transport factor 2 family protein [Verrucomicrobia bacterium]|nr:nuclear transport factor 2 family protein [Verrucomicrobiota bacterium]
MTRPSEISFDNPESIVQAQFDAFNRRDLEALVAIYADDAELYEHPTKLLAKGSIELRERFALRFAEPNLHACLLKRIIMGGTVIDHELVTRTFPDGCGTIELTMIYLVESGRISKAWSIAGPKTLTA